MSDATDDASSMLDLILSELPAGRVAFVVLVAIVNITVNGFALNNLGRGSGTSGPYYGPGTGPISSFIPARVAPVSSDQG